MRSSSTARRAINSSSEPATRVASFVGDGAIKPAREVTALEMVLKCSLIVTDALIRDER